MLANGIMRKTNLVASARLAQSVERKALNLVVVGSSPTVGVYSLMLCETWRACWINSSISQLLNS